MVMLDNAYSLLRERSVERYSPLLDDDDEAREAVPSSIYNPKREPGLGFSAYT